MSDNMGLKEANENKKNLAIRIESREDGLKSNTNLQIKNSRGLLNI